jgi:hypothetical protein
MCKVEQKINKSEKIMGKVRDNLLEGSHAPPVRPSDKS